MSHTIAHVALPVPLSQSFSYHLGETNTQAVVGARVKVPFGARQLIGVITEVDNADDISKLKPIIEIIDKKAIFSNHLIELITWLSQYYLHPIGEVFASAMPALIKKGASTTLPEQTFYQINPASDKPEIRKNAHQQQKLWQAFTEHKKLSNSQISELALNRATLNKWLKAGFINSVSQIQKAKSLTINSGLTLNTEQKACLERFEKLKPAFQCILLEGVTGSGKTEVYLQMIAKCLARGKQAMVLVPEIGLTRQTLNRFNKRFDCDIALLHSNQTEQTRLYNWQLAHNQHAKIIIGTRSALFADAQNLGLIIIDEEHDLSYKQQDGLKYSARDAAIMRAKREGIPIILGSATPSLESLHHATNGKYQHWQLTSRAGDSVPVKTQLVDIKNQTMLEGISEQVLAQIEDTITQQKQALIFINRRGFAPTLICHDCGWIAQCPACDQNFTIHLKANQLRCHHCHYISPIAHQCPECNSSNLVHQGEGTQRIEAFLRQQHPETAIMRIDRDSSTSQQQFDEQIAQIEQQTPAILVGTQMLAKGHHFPNITLVVVLNTDSGLLSSDYRALERFGQLITQVTGRAGREKDQGLALIQTHYSEHPDLNHLVSNHYHDFALNLLAQRHQRQLPPFTFQALLRLEDQDPDRAFSTLQQLQQSHNIKGCISIGPYAASLHRRAYYYRYYLLLQAPHRTLVHQACQQILQVSTKLTHRQQRFSIDIDPQEVH